MDFFGLTAFDFFYYFLLFIGFKGLIMLHFMCRFIKKPIAWWQQCIFLLFLYGLKILQLAFQLPSLAEMLLEILLLLCWNMLLLRQNMSLSAITAVLALTVQWMVSGIMNSIIPLAMNYMGLWGLAYINPWFYFGDFLSLFFIGLSYFWIVKKFSVCGQLENQYVYILLLPICFILLVFILINDLYGNYVVADTTAGILYPKLNTLEILAIQLAAYGSFMALLSAGRQLINNLHLEKQNALFSLQLSAQKAYLQEAASRYNQTRSFRHDFKNHLLVLDGLLAKMQISKARQYLQKLQEAANTLSFPVQTGNTIADTLLSSKFVAARQAGIQVQCTLKLPEENFIDDIDLSIVLANAIDNAVTACIAITGNTNKYIRLTSMQKGRLFMLLVENSYIKKENEQKVLGIGLSNIEAVAKKYQGTINIELGENYYKISVLFVLSQH